MATAAPQSTLAGPQIGRQTLDRELSIETLTKPTFRGVLLTGLPGFLREGFLPLGAFYVGLRLSGLGVGIAASVAVSVLIYLYERRAGRDALVVRLSLAFVALQSAAGLVAHSAVVYLAQPVLANAAWGFAFLISAAIGRPLAGALACAWYPAALRPVRPSPATVSAPAVAIPGLASRTRRAMRSLRSSGGWLALAFAGSSSMPVTLRTADNRSEGRTALLEGRSALPIPSRVP